MNESTPLLVFTTMALIAVNLAHFTIATGFGAVALAAFVVGYMTRWHAPRFGIYAFLIAELSPISLQADIFTAFTYQVLSVLLLTAVVLPFPRLSKLSAYAWPARMTLVVTVASLVPGIVLIYANSRGLAALQAASLSGALLLVVVGAALFARRTMLLSPTVRGA